MRTQDGNAPKFSHEPENTETENLDNVIKIVDRNSVETFIEESSPEISREKLKVSSEKANATPTPKTGEADEIDFLPIVPLYTNESLMTADGGTSSDNNWQL